jgi:hypothetical protein
MPDEQPPPSDLDGDDDLDDENPHVAEEPEGGPGHPLRAQDVQALIAKLVA